MSVWHDRGRQREVACGALAGCVWCCDKMVGWMRVPDMQLMEAKLKQLKAKKDAEEARKKAKAAALNNPNRAAAAMEAARAVQEREQHAANLLPQAPARRDNGPPVRYVDSKDSNAPVPMPAMAHPPRPANARASVDSSAHGCVRTCAAVALALHRSPTPHLPCALDRACSCLALPQHVSPPSLHAAPAQPTQGRLNAGCLVSRVSHASHVLCAWCVWCVGRGNRLGNGLRPAAINVDLARQSEPHFAPPLFAPPAHPPPHRLQAVPSPMARVGLGRDDIFGDGLGADLISRQKVPAPCRHLPASFTAICAHLRLLPPLPPSQHAKKKVAPP